MNQTSFGQGKPSLLSIITLDTIICVFLIAGLVFVPVFGSLSVVVFLAMGALLFLRYPAASVNLLIPYWYLLLLPVFCTLTFMWSAYPGITFRFGVQLSATIVITILLTHRLSARGFILAHFFWYGIAILASNIFRNPREDIGAWVGIFESKNALAGVASIFIVISVGLIIDRSIRMRFRFLAFLGLGMGAIPLVFAQSLGARLLVPLTILILITTWLAPNTSSMKRLVIFIYGALFFALVGLLIFANYGTLVALFLEATGKDLTLTGRTDLWAIAIEYIAESPFFGLGYQAFWVPGNPPAEAIWFLFGIGSRGGFNFHNMYLSNAVEIGLIGLAMQVFVLYGAAYLTAKWALTKRSIEACILFALVSKTIMSSFVEVSIFFQFNSNTVLVVGAFVYGLQARSEASGK